MKDNALAEIDLPALNAPISARCGSRICDIGFAVTDCLCLLSLPPDTKAKYVFVFKLVL